MIVNDLDLSKNGIWHTRMKHDDVRYHWICKVIDKNFMKIQKIRIDNVRPQPDLSWLTLIKLGVSFLSGISGRMI